MSSVTRSEAFLQERLARMWRVVPIETFEDGQVFDTQEYEPGTIIIYRDELLTGNPASVDIDVEALRGEPLPARPMDASPGAEARSIHDAQDHVRYFTNVMWGVVATSKGGEGLHIVPAGAIQRSAGGAQLRAPMLQRPQPSITIGKTEHYATKDSERVERINALDVLAYGETEQKRRSASGWAARLAFGRDEHETA